MVYPLDHRSFIKNVTLQRNQKFILVEVHTIVTLHNVYHERLCHLLPDWSVSS